MYSNFSKEQIITKQTQSRFAWTLKFLEKYIKSDMKILDVGEFNNLSREIIKKFSCQIQNTQGDLDEAFYFPYIQYDLIICSHILEHLFSPIWILKKARKFCKNGTLIIFLPCRPKFLWTKNHFHEIDKYRLGALASESGWKIQTVKYHKVWRKWYTYFTGIRMFLRLFFEWNAIYILK